MSSKNNKFSKILSGNQSASANALFFRGSLDSTRYGDDLKKYAQLLHSPAAKYVLPILDCAQKKWETRIDDPDIVTSIKDVASTIKSMEVRQIGSTYSKVACKEEDPAMCSEITCKAMTGTGGITSHGIPFDVPYNYDLTWRNVPVNGYLTEPEKKVLGCDAHSLSDRFCYKMTPKDCAEAIVKSGTADRFIAGIKNMKPFIVKQDGTIVPK